MFKYCNLTKRYFKSNTLVVVLILVATFFVSNQIAQASPFGVGKFGANVPFGSQTSLTIATNGNVTIPITPTPSGTLSTSTSTVTVTSTDVVGYKLYIQTPTAGANLVLGGVIHVNDSSNSSPASLAVNTWGYNTDGSSNFVGFTGANVPSLIRTGTGPYESGDVTTVTYGLKMDDSLPAGDYSATVVYTAVPQTQ